MKQHHRPACRPQTVVDGVPVCGHGQPMYLFGGRWRCAVRVRERVRVRDATRIRILHNYDVGTVGFSASERKAMLDGEAIRPRHP